MAAALRFKIPAGRLEQDPPSQTIGCRYEQGSTIITPNQTENDCREFLAKDGLTATSVLDRLPRRAHAIGVAGNLCCLDGLKRRLQ